jgi:hypothetical protein
VTKRAIGNEPLDESQRPQRQMRLPGFVADEDIGFGDAISRATSYFGVQACGGCERRRVEFNRWMVFTTGRRK